MLPDGRIGSAATRTDDPIAFFCFFYNVLGFVIGLAVFAYTESTNPKVRIWGVPVVVINDVGEEFWFALVSYWPHAIT